MASAPSAPDPSVIAQLANYFFQAQPGGPLPAQDSPGMPLVPPSPTMTPAPSVVTSAAPFIPAPLPFGPPDLPPTTIASIAPTPNISTPATPAAPHGLPDVPQPGSTAGGFAPNAPGDIDAAGPLAHLAEFTSLVPAEHLAASLGAQTLETPWPKRAGPFPITVDSNATPEGIKLALSSTAPDGICTSTYTNPSMGGVPITRKNDGETLAASSCSGLSIPVQFAVNGLNAATSSKIRFWSRSM